MKTLQLVTALLLLSTAVFADLKTVSSVPDIGVLVEEIGGEKVKNITLATGYEDIHAVPLRPSFAVKMRNADLLFSFGLGAEHAWLPALAKKSRNRKVMKGGDGWITLNKGFKILAIPTTIDRSEGHQHPDGNPHFNLSPESYTVMIKNITVELSAKDPDNSDYYYKRAEALQKKLDALIIELKEKGVALKGKKLISYHADVIYLCDFYGMEKIGTIEPKPGVPPTTSNVSKVIRKAKAEKISFVLYSQAQDPKMSKSVADKVGVKPVMFYNMINPDVADLFTFHRKNLEALLEGIK